MHRSRPESVTAELAHRLGVDPLEIGEYVIEVCTGLNFDQGLKDRTRAEIVKMFGGTLSARARYDLGSDPAYGAERFNGAPVEEEDRVCRRVEIGRD